MPAGQRQHGRPPVGILGALLAGPDGDIWLCRRGGANMVGRRGKAGRRQAAAQNFCEVFAPRNKASRLCGERGANRAAGKAAGGRWRRGTSVKFLLPETVSQGFARSGEQIAYQKTAAESLPPLLTYLKNSLFCVLFRSLFLHNLRQRLSLKLFKQDFLDSAKLLMESARGIL